MPDTKNSTLAVIPKTFNNTEKFLTYVAPAGKVFASQYRFVGGRLKTGEDYSVALKREFQEEFKVHLTQLELLYTKHNILGGALFLCSGGITNEPIRQENAVGEPEWKTAEELFYSNLVPNCKIALYCYLLENNLNTLDLMIPVIKKDADFVSFLAAEAEDLYLDLMGRINATI